MRCCSACGAPFILDIRPSRGSVWILLIKKDSWRALLPYFLCSLHCTHCTHCTQLHSTALHCTFSGLLRPTHLFRTHMAAAAVSITVRDQILPRSSALTAIMITQPASQCGWLGRARARSAIVLILPVGTLELPTCTAEIVARAACCLSNLFPPECAAEYRRSTVRRSPGSLPKLRASFAC